MRGPAKITVCGVFVALLSIVAGVAGPRAVAGEQPVRILALGDSLMQGYGVPDGEEFPAQLQKALNANGANAIVINAGVSGDTSAGGLARIDWSLTDSPDAAIVEFGGNDALRGLSPADMEKNIAGMLKKLKDRHIPVLLAGMKAPRNMGPEYDKQFDTVFPRLAKKYHTLFYPFFLDGVALKATLLQDDGIHPNPKGVAVIVKRILPLAEKLVARAKAGR